VEQATSATAAAAVSRTTNNSLRRIDHCFGRTCRVREARECHGVCSI
jgi:hypothetical protein